MNKLQIFLAETFWDEVKAMNLLQDWGVISDNAVWAKDVPDCDAPKAISFLSNYQGEG